MMLLRIIAFLGVALAPIPLALYVLSRIERRVPRVSRAAVIVLSLWVILESLVAHVLALFHCLTLAAALTTEMVLLLVGLGLLWKRWSPIAELYASAREGMRTTHHYERIILIGAACLALSMLWQTASRPTGDYDSLAYHLPYVAESYQKGYPTAFEQHVADRIPADRYPYGWETMSLLFVLPFGRDMFVTLPKWISWLLLGATAYGLTRLLGGRRFYPIIASAQIMSVPMVYGVVNNLQVDLPLAAIFMASVFLALGWRDDRNPRVLFVLVPLLGLLPAIKPTGLIYTALAGICLLMVKRSRGSNTRKRSAPDGPRFMRPICVSLLIVIALFLGSYWYLRNLIEFGNPLGFTEIRVLGHRYFEGSTTSDYIRGTSLASVFDIASGKDWNVLALQLREALGLSFLVTSVAFLFLLPRTLFRRTDPFRSNRIIIIALLFFCIFLYPNLPYTGNDGANQQGVTPWVGQAFRYGIPIIGFLGVLAAIGMSILKVPPLPLVLASFLPMTSALGTGRMAYGIVLAAILVSAIYTGRIRTHIITFSAPVYAKIALMALSVVSGLLLLIPMASARRQAEKESLNQGISAFLDDHIPVGERIGYFSCEHRYPLYGANLDKKLVYMRSECKTFHDFMNELVTKEVKYISVGPLPIYWRSLASNRKYQWLTTRDECFRRLWGENPKEEAVLYEFVGVGKQCLTKGSS